MAQEPAKIHLVPHFHYDPVWIEDQRTYTGQAFDLVHAYLEACRQDEGFHFLLSDLDCLQPFMGAHSEHRDYVRELVRRGRIGTGGSYNEPNEMTVQGEAVIRNMLYGRLYHEGHLGAKPAVYLPLDVFGHCPQLPQIAAKAGFQAIVWSKEIRGAPPVCYALAPDGTTILQKREPYWYYPETYKHLLDTVADGLEHQAALGLRYDLRFMGMDMAAPRPWVIGASQELAQMDPSVVLSTPDKYLDAVRPQLAARRAAIPISGRDVSWYHMGTAVTRAELKIANRLAENRLLNAEKWATLAALLGAAYPDLPLDKAWRQVLFAAHHDAITGTSSDIPFLDLLAGYREALELAAEVEEKALAYTAGRVSTESGKRAPRQGAALVVFNPMGWVRTDVCRARVQLEGRLRDGFRLYDQHGRETACQVVELSRDRSQAEIVFIASELPSLGYLTYYLRPAPEVPSRAAAEERPEAEIENEHLRIQARASLGGGLTSIYDKRLKRELLDPAAGPGNEVFALGEDPNREHAPWELFTTGGMVRSSARQAKVEVKQGPVLKQIRATVELPERCTLIQEVTLYAGLPRVDLRTTVDGYRGQHELLALTFPLAVEGAPTFEDRFATMLRKRSAGRLDFRTRLQENLSRCGLGAAQNWVEVGPAPSLAVMSRRQRKGVVPLGPCAIVTGADLSDRTHLQPLLTALLRRGVTCYEQPDTEDPDAGDGAAFRISIGRKNAYSQRLLDANSEASTRLTQAAEQEQWGAVLMSRPDARGEAAGVPVLIVDTNSPDGAAHLVEALAAEIAADTLAIPESCDFSDAARPPEDHGVALINRGTVAASLENDGTLAALLFHTSSWEYQAWGEGALDRFFVPEHRTHVFEHSLYPHEGDWRTGGVVRVGHEVNNPLRAHQTTIHSGPLPPSLSFVSTDTANLVITAVKPVGNPPAEHRTSERARPDQGFLVRAYECEGRDSAAAFRFPALPEEAWLTDLLERKTGEVQITKPGWRRPGGVEVALPGCGLVTLAVRLPRLFERGAPTELGPAEEPCRPIYSRYWDHNLGAAPMGNQPVTLWVRGPIPIGETTRFSLGLSNDARDREISGVIQLSAPEEWTMIPRQVPYRIAADSQAVYEVMVVVPADAKPCFLRVTVEEGGQVLQDVVPIGEILPLDAQLERADGGFAVRVRNPNADYVEGQLALITPLESWGSCVETSAATAVEPRAQPFRLEAGAEERFAFRLSGPGEGMWAVAKLMWYGRVQYVQEAVAG